MSIRMVAVELYRLMKQVDELERKLRGLKPGQERDETERQLREARSEMDRLRKMIEGAKDD